MSWAASSPDISDVVAKPAVFLCSRNSVTRAIHYQKFVSPRSVLRKGPGLLEVTWGTSGRRKVSRSRILGSMRRRSKQIYLQGQEARCQIAILYRPRAVPPEEPVQNDVVRCRSRA